MREILLMAEGRRAEWWNYFAPLIATIANANRDPKRSKAIKIEDIHPYARKAKKAQNMKDFFAAVKGSGLPQQTMSLDTFAKRG